jgi:hypothetical protein|tara:strand:- start:1478 stop:1651 length:174 start_codon:yes stop_codon:yes gene_type:complete
MGTFKQIKALLSSDTLIATIAVIGVSLFFGFVSFYLAWISYQERYGISFEDFIKLTF